MKKKPSPGSRLFFPTPGPHSPASKCYSIPAADLFLYARSFHTAAKKLAGLLQLDTRQSADSDVSPVVFIYRHAVELHLKAVVLGDGGNFLATKPDALSVHKTHSVSWLAQFVCQIVTAADLEGAFKCAGVESLADFKAVIEELNAVDPGSYVFRLPVSAEGLDSAPGHIKLTMRDFARRMDALLELLDSTADALAAEWDLRSASDVEEEWPGGDDFEPTIQ